MCHLEEPRAHSHRRPKAVTESQPFVLLARSWTQGLWGVWGPCITYDTVRDPHRQISQSLFASLVHPHLVRMQSQSTDEVTIYLGSPWATGKPFRVAFKPSIPLQSLRAPSPLCVLGRLSLSPARAVAPALRANLLIVAAWSPFEVLRCLSLRPPCLSGQKLTVQPSLALKSWSFCLSLQTSGTISTGYLAQLLYSLYFLVYHSWLPCSLSPWASLVSMPLRAEIPPALGICHGTYNEANTCAYLISCESCAFDFPNHLLDLGYLIHPYSVTGLSSSLWACNAELRESPPPSAHSSGRGWPGRGWFSCWMSTFVKSDHKAEEPIPSSSFSDMS